MHHLMNYAMKLFRADTSNNRGGTRWNAILRCRCWLIAGVHNASNRVVAEPSIPNPRRPVHIPVATPCARDRCTFKGERLRSRLDRFRGIKKFTKRVGGLRCRIA
eukprot:1468104-Pyramimonas_sp.AAC.3